MLVLGCFYKTMCKRHVPAKDLLSPFFLRSPELLRPPSFLLSSVPPSLRPSVPPSFPPSLLPSLVPIHLGLFAGLTLGFMGLDKIGLEIVMEAGDPESRRCARRIAPVRRDGNLLLCSLLFGNVAVNVLISILMSGEDEREGRKEGGREGGSGVVLVRVRGRRKG